MAALAIVPLGAACGGAEVDESTGGGTDTLVGYSREGGIRFQSGTLAISTDGDATVRSEGCAVRFRLRNATRGRLQRALSRTDLSDLAGDYPPPSGAADVITEEISAGRDAVRIGDFSSLPANVRRELAPLVAILGEILAAGERRVRSSPCGGADVGEGAG